MMQWDMSTYPPALRIPDMGPLPSPLPSSPRYQTCYLPPPPLVLTSIGGVVAPETRIVGKRTVRIELECRFVSFSKYLGNAPDNRVRDYFIIRHCERF